MDRTITASELEKNLSDVLNRVRDRRERFIIERDGVPVAGIAPVSTTLGITAGELVARLGDLPLPYDGFADDLEAIQVGQAKVEFREWPS